MCFPAVAMVIACGPSLHRAPTHPDADDFGPPREIVPTGLANDRLPPDVLMPGDVVDVQIISLDTDEITGLIVGADGSIPVGPAGHIKVAGLSLADATKRLREALRNYDRFSEPILKLARPDGRRVTVVGAVERPGVYTVSPGLRLADAVALGGGPRNALHEGDVFVDADLRAARILRDGKALPVSLARALQGDARHNVYIHPGDLIWLPSTSNQRVSVLGEVKRPASLRYRPGFRLSEALAAAGGATKDADDADIRIVRGPLSRPRVYRASLAHLVDGRRPDVELAPGDIVFVTEHWFASATEVLRRLSPLLIAMGVAAALAN